MKIGRTKSEVPHSTELQGRSQSVAFALIGINEGTIMLGQGERGDQVPLRNLIGETGEPFTFFERQKWAWHGRGSSMIKKGVGNRG
jgi:hypothetical protein